MAFGGNEKGVEENFSLLDIAQARAISKKCVKIDQEHYASLCAGDYIYYVNKTNQRMSARLKVVRVFNTKNTGELMLYLTYEAMPGNSKIYTPFPICAKNISELWKETDAALKQLIDKLDRANPQSTNAFAL